MSRRLTLDPARPSGEAIAAAVTVLNRGGVVAYPTDTQYGLAVDPRSGAAVQRLFDLKGRPADLAIPLIAGDLSQVEQVAAVITAPARRLIERFWPGPLTLILPAAACLAVAIHGGRRTVAVRVPDHLVARALAAGFKFPVTSTSANQSGKPPAVTADEVLAGVGQDLDLVLDAGPTPGGEPSTIVDVTGAPALVRAGAVAWDRVLESLK
jgi:L-threonylcarbamoyladenylate synthase